MISILIITKGHNSLKLYMKLQFLLSAYLLIMAYQVSQKYVECLKSYGVDMIL